MMDVVARMERNRLKKGQTLIIALVVLGVLLVIGLVFLGILNRSILQTARYQRRTLAEDLAEAGIRYAHSQLLNSELGADWRPRPTITVDPVDPAPAFSTDPDILYLRPASGMPLRSPTDTQLDLGGPDGLGPFTRLNFKDGRDLVRVRYALSDANLFSASPVGPLRTPGNARMYIIIESVGRPGEIRPNDPTTVPYHNPIKISRFTDSDDFRASFGATKDQDALIVQSRKLIAFANIGITDHALFITNKFRVTRPADLGYPIDQTGAVYDTENVNVAARIGGPINDQTGTSIRGGGSIWSNADLLIHGTVFSDLNPALGDQILVAGNILSDADATLNIVNPDGSTGATLTGAQLNSRSPDFDTQGGKIRDGVAQTDVQGRPRNIVAKQPPSIVRQDPSTGSNRYLSMSRDSGTLGAKGNTGQFGHGGNVYVNNRADQQTPTGENAREQTGSSQALFYDLLNPNNGQTGSGWRGPFYIPVGAFVQLREDGFDITRDPRGPVEERTWKNPDGTDSGLSTIRFRVKRLTTTSGKSRVYIVDELTTNIAQPRWEQDGYPFGGVLFFEGNVRIRGLIPGNIQLLVVSMANIYIEGSITKSYRYLDANNNLTTVAGVPSSSGIGLAARQNVIVNTTQFFGLGNSDVEEVQSDPSALAWNSLRVRNPDGVLNLLTEFLLDPSSNPDINQQVPYAMEYRQTSSSGPAIASQLLLSHTMDNGPATSTYATLDVNYGSGDGTWVWNYFFNLNTGYDVQYPLGAQTWQRYPKFESRGFPLVDPASDTFTSFLLSSTGSKGQYKLQTLGTNTLRLRASTQGTQPANDYQVARAAITPHDVRIEATLYAEDGSLFVIPGHWFNPNPNDSRANYAGLGSTDDERNAVRAETFGSYPEMPFYGEPLDVKITILGAVSENMPAPVSQQLEWIRKWGWIPKFHGASGELIPYQHADGADLSTTNYVSNLRIIYDPLLAAGRPLGFQNNNNAYARVDDNGNPLPPLPRLPVSPTLSYFGEVNP